MLVTTINHNLLWRYIKVSEVEGNSPLEDYFCRLSQNEVNFLSGQVLLIGLNKNENSRKGEVIDTHVFDLVRGRLLRGVQGNKLLEDKVSPKKPPYLDLQNKHTLEWL